MVGERQLRSGVRTLTPHDQPAALRPGGQINHLGDLTDLAVLPLAAVLVERDNPRVLGDREDRGADLLGQLVADREAHVGLTAVVNETMRSAGGVRADQDLQSLDVLGRDLRQRPVQHSLVIIGGVRAGVPRPEQTAERLTRLIEVDLQRVKPVAALVVPGRLLLLRMRSDQRRVNIERQPLRRTIKLPEPSPRPRVRLPDRVQQPWRGRDPVDHPKRRRVRRHRPEQHVLLTDRTEVRHALATIGHHHHEIANHPARVMTATPLLDRSQPQRQRLREPHLVSDLGHERAARMRDQTRSVRCDFYGYRASITHHPQGEPPSSGSRTFDKPKDPCSPGRFRAPAPRGRGHYCTLRVKCGGDCSEVVRSVSGEIGALRKVLT